MGNDRFPDPQVTWSEREARAVLAAWRRSGEPMAVFARRHRVAVARLYWWKSRLDEERRTAPLISLVPANVTRNPGAAGGAAVVVRVANGVTIEVNDAGPSWVAALVRELAST